MCVKPSMLDGLKNGFAILQVKRDCQKMFLSLEALGNEVPDIRNYDVVYKADYAEKEMDLDDPDVFAFLYMFYMEHADCTGCKMQEGDEI